MTKPFSEYRAPITDEMRLRKSLDEMDEPPCVEYGSAVRMSNVSFKMNALIYWRSRPSVFESIDFEAGELVDWQEFVKRFNIKVRKQKDANMSKDIINNVEPLAEAVWNPKAGEILSAREAAEAFTETVESAWNRQVGGSHYKDQGIQPMHYSMANKLDGCQHTIVKYVTRFRQKGGIEDLKKARHVLDMLIEWEEKGGAI